MQMVKGTTLQLLVCGRFHRKQSSHKSAIDFSNVFMFIESVLTFASDVALLIDDDDSVLVNSFYESISNKQQQGYWSKLGTKVPIVYNEQELSWKKLNPVQDDHGTVERVHIMRIKYWGNFIPALNIAVMEAARLGFNIMCFQSIEVSPPPKHILALYSEMDETTLVVGHYLPGHEWQAEDNSIQMEVRLTGLTSPWNTLAMWNVQKLAITGFLPLAEGIVDNFKAAFEEPSVIALHQTLFPHQSHAKLIRFKQDFCIWRTNWDDEGRKQWHEEKMMSRKTIAHSHLLKLGVEEVGRVYLKWHP